MVGFGKSGLVRLFSLGYLGRGERFPEFAKNHWGKVSHLFRIWRSNLPRKQTLILADYWEFYKLKKVCTDNLPNISVHLEQSSGLDCIV